MVYLAVDTNLDNKCKFRVVKAYVLVNETDISLSIVLEEDKELIISEK